jgi:transcriptional regulator with XRE-family HTH domain
MFEHPLATARTERGWSRQKLADEAGVSVHTVARIESDCRLERSMALLRCANALELAPSDIVGPNQTELANELERSASVYVERQVTHAR